MDQIDPTQPNNEDSNDDFQRLIDAAPDESPSEVTIPPTFGGCPTMSSLQIAEITGKNHADILRDIRNTLEQAEIDESKFASVYSGGNGQARPCYILPRRECDLVVSGYSVKYRLAIIDRWQELEAKQSSRDPMEILSDPASMRALLLGYSDKVLALQTTVSELTPMAEALAKISRSEGNRCISTAAKALQMRPSELFQWLSANNWIYRRGKEWMPYGAREAQGVLYCKIATFSRTDGTERICYQTLVTPKGLCKLAEILSQGESAA